MDSSTRQALEVLIQKFSYKYLISLVKSKETGPELESRTQLEKATKEDFAIIAGKCGKIFLAGIDKYMKKNHVVSFDKIPPQHTKRIAIASINRAINEWNNELMRKGAS